MGIKVLVVDDQEAVADTLQLVLKSKGLEARAVNSAEAARTELEHNDYDVLLCDLNLDTQSDGLEVIAEAKRKKPGIKTILNSGIDYVPKDLDNIDAVTFKPNIPNDLVELIKTIAA